MMKTMKPGDPDFMTTLTIAAQAVYGDRGGHEVHVTGPAAHHAPAERRLTIRVVYTLEDGWEAELQGVTIGLWADLLREV